MYAGGRHWAPGRAALVGQSGDHHQRSRGPREPWLPLEAWNEKNVLKEVGGGGGRGLVLLQVPAGRVAG